MAETETDTDSLEIDKHASAANLSNEKIHSHLTGDTVVHKNNSLPNGCIKHSLEDNGYIRLVRASKDEACIDKVNCDDSTNSGNVCCDATSEGCGMKSAASDLAENLGKITITEDKPKENDCSDTRTGLQYVVYQSEKQMPDIMKLITKDLSEPYSIYTYRYFIHNWPKLCFLAMDGHKCVGAIVCKLDLHKKMVRRGYIAMLAVDQNYRRRKIGSSLVMKAIRAMVADDCDEVVLETEITNKAALRLYENLGFVRDKRLFRYYLNGVDALRLKLWLR